MPSQQPDGQLQKQHNIQTQITRDNKQDTYGANKTSRRLLKILITTQYKNKLINLSVLISLVKISKSLQTDKSRFMA